MPARSLFLNIIVTSLRSHTRSGVLLGNLPENSRPRKSSSKSLRSCGTHAVATTR